MLNPKIYAEFAENLGLIRWLYGRAVVFTGPVNLSLRLSVCIKIAKEKNSAEHMRHLRRNSGTLYCVAYDKQLPEEVMDINLPVKCGDCGREFSLLQEGCTAIKHGSMGITGQSFYCGVCMYESPAYLKGREARRLGYSIHYNEFRHKGTAQEFTEWQRGWKDENLR